MAIHRDYYEGFTLRPFTMSLRILSSYLANGSLSPLASPWNSDLLKLL